MGWGKRIEQIREGREKVDADRRRLLERMQEKRLAEEKARADALAASAAKRARFSSIDTDACLSWARRFFFMELVDASSPPRALNRPTLDLLAAFLTVLRENRSKAILQWPVGQSDVALLHPLAMLSVLCASDEQTTNGYTWCPAVRDFRTLYFPWRGSGTGADLRGTLIERKSFLKRNQFHLTRPRAGQPEHSSELGLFHETLAHLVGLSSQDQLRPHLAHPTLAEIYPTFGALGGDDAARPFARVTRDLFGRVEHGAGLRKMVDNRGAVSQPKTAPFAFFGVCPRASLTRAMDHAALTEAVGGRSPDVCLLDLGPPGMRRLGHGWEETLALFVEALRKKHGDVPVMAITHDSYVLRQLGGILQMTTSADAGATGWRTSVLFRATEDPFDPDPSIGTVSPVSFQFHSAGGNGVEALHAMSAAARICSDASRAGNLRHAIGGVRRAMNLPCGLDAAYAFLSESEGQAAAEIFLERRSEGTATTIIQQCLDASVDQAERTAMAAAEQAVRKAYAEFARDTPIGSLLADVAEAVARKSSKSIIVFSSETERRLGERRMLADQTSAELLQRRLSSDYVRITTVSEIEVTLKKIEGERDRNSWKRLVLVTPSRSQLSVLLGRAWLPQELVVVSDRDFVVGLAKTYRGLAEHPDLAGADRIGARLAAAAKAARIEGEARDVGPIDLQLTAVANGIDGQVIDLTGQDDDDNDREVLELGLESGRIIRVRPRGLIIRHNRHADINSFERSTGRDIQPGEMIVVPDASFVQEARSVLPVRVLAQGWIDVYHAAVEAALPTLPGDSMAAKARFVAEQIAKSGVQKGAQAVVDWLKVGEHKLEAKDELRSHAPLRWREFKVFMELLGHSALSEKIWKEGISTLRTDRRRAGAKMAQAFASVLVDPHGSSASLATDIKTKIITLRKRALEHVDGVVECRQLRAGEGNAR